MNKLWYLCVFMLVSVNALAYAVPVIVAGTIYGGDHTTEISGADVVIQCHGETKYATSDSGGDYAVDMSGTACVLGDTVTVTATKEGQSGQDSDSVLNYTFIDLAIVDVSIPEFGTVAAGLGLVGAAAAYFWRRK
jgi:hypothetical protein